MIFNQAMETASREDMQKLQLARLKETVKRCYDNVTFPPGKFRPCRGETEDIRCLEDIRRLPFMKKTDLRENYPFKLFAVDLSKVIRIHGSSETESRRWSVIRERISKIGQRLSPGQFAVPAAVRVIFFIMHMDMVYSPVASDCTMEWNTSV